jgi:NAD(P)-dependent dehydrogenase (short-subunit alcohol dehydrogenase family)
VVGCGPSLGGSVALRFAREGFAIAASNTFASTATPKYEFFPIDCTDATSVARAFAKAAETLGGSIGVLIYNAGG